MEYKGAIIEPGDGLIGGYRWNHPDHIDFDYGEQGYSYCGTPGAMGTGSTIEECKEQIDEFIEGLEENTNQ